jgi:L-amino acid N-acyltransferase YncA/predicted CoA-binding protein
VRIRPARREDRERIEDYLIGLSDESRCRFGGVAVDVSDIARRSTEVDYRNHLTLLAVAEAGAGEVIGGAQYIREGDPSRAEVSVSVADALQGRGLGSILVAHLADAADDAGISTFHAHVLPENHRMIDVFRRSGFPVHLRASPGTVDVEFPTALTAEALAAYEDRERIAAANAVRAILQPTSVAVIGASRDAASIGGRLLHNLLDPPFAGVVHAVNPKSAVVQGIAAFPSVLDIPGHVDVAFVAVPAAHVIAVARECGEKGVRGLVVISAGFAETGSDGAALQRELLDVSRIRYATDRSELHGGGEHRPRRATQRHVRDDVAPTGRVGFLAERRARDRGHGASRGARLGAVDVRFHREQGRHLRQRSPELLGRRPEHRCRVDVPRVVREPPPVRQARPPARRPHTDRRREERAQRSRVARRCRTPGRCWPPRTPPWTRSSGRAA